MRFSPSRKIPLHKSTDMCMKGQWEVCKLALYKRHLLCLFIYLFLRMSDTKCVTESPYMEMFGCVLCKWLTLVCGHPIYNTPNIRTRLRTISKIQMISKWDPIICPHLFLVLFKPVQNIMESDSPVVWWHVVKNETLSCCVHECVN